MQGWGGGLTHLKHPPCVPLNCIHILRVYIEFITKGATLPYALRGARNLTQAGAVQWRHCAHLPRAADNAGHRMEETCSLSCSIYRGNRVRWVFILFFPGHLNCALCVGSGHYHFDGAVRGHYYWALMGHYYCLGGVRRHLYSKEGTKVVLFTVWRQ